MWSSLSSTFGHVGTKKWKPSFMTGLFLNMYIIVAGVTLFMRNERRASLLDQMSAGFTFSLY